MLRIVRFYEICLHGHLASLFEQRIAPSSTFLIYICAHCSYLLRFALKCLKLPNMFRNWNLWASSILKFWPLDCGYLRFPDFWWWYDSRWLLIGSSSFFFKTIDKRLNQFDIWIFSFLNLHFLANLFLHCGDWALGLTIVVRNVGIEIHDWNGWHLGGFLFRSHRWHSTNPRMIKGGEIICLLDDLLQLFCRGIIIIVHYIA